VLKACGVDIKDRIVKFEESVKPVRRLLKEENFLMTGSSGN